MENLYSEDRVREFYEDVGDKIMGIEEMDIPEARKEELYVLVDESIRRHDENWRKHFISIKELGKLCEKMGDATLGLEDIDGSFEKFERDAENFELFVEIFGLRSLYSSRVQKP